MSRVMSSIRVLLAALALLAIAGCSDEPPSPPRPHIDPQQAAQEALKLYDKKGDGVLDAKELKDSPPLFDLLQNIKAKSPDHPDTLSAADIASRLEGWAKGPSILIPAAGMVSVDGKPLDAATVTFEPEPFLGPSYHSHQGQTNGAGLFQLDPDLKELGNGIFVGLYRVRISKKVGGKETIPARYNTETELGVELSPDNRDLSDSTNFLLKGE